MSVKEADLSTAEITEPGTTVSPAPGVLKVTTAGALSSTSTSAPDWLTEMTRQGSSSPMRER